MSEINNVTTTKRTLYSLALVCVLGVLVFAVFNLYQSVSNKNTQPINKPAPMVMEEFSQPILTPAEQEEADSDSENEVNIPSDPTPMPTGKPVPEVVAPEFTIPPLAQSDVFVKEQLSHFYTKPVLNLIVNDDIIRRVVVFVDNLAQGKLAQQHNPFVKPLESFSVQDQDVLTISPESYQRYDAYVDLFTQIPPEQAVALFKQYHVLFDEAYQEVGLPDTSFDQRIFDAIDVIMTTPVVTGNVPLIAQSVTYKFAYSEWEQLPAAQKQLLRMGPKNLKKLKAALKQIKQHLPQPVKDEQ